MNTNFDEEEENLDSDYLFEDINIDFSDEDFFDSNELDEEDI